MAFRRILIALDGSPLAAHAAETGAELARSLGAHLGLVSVVDTRATDAIASDQSPAALREQARDEARRAIEAVRALEPAKAAAFEFLPEGKPGEEIVRAAREWQADLVVIGSHGRGGLERMLMGSVAEAVLRQAPCPVLIVRAQR
jgi:nucleotide-binding universal stress UspA family protein